MGYGCHSLAYSAAGFGFQASHVGQLEDVSRRVATVAKLFCDLNIAHNIFITKGTPFVRSTGVNKSNRVLKVMIWARRNVTGAKDLVQLGQALLLCIFLKNTHLMIQEANSHFMVGNVIF